MNSFLSDPTDSHAQPLPKRVLAASENCFFISSKEPKALLMALASSPEGALAPPGAIHFQNLEWL